MSEQLVFLEKELFGNHGMDLIEKCKLFSATKVRVIKMARNKLNRKLIRTHPSLTVFRRYITYEEGLLFQVNFVRIDRENQSGTIKVHERQVEKLIISKLMVLYKEAIEHFANERKLVEHFFEFCDATDRHLDVKPYLNNYLLLHGASPDVWFVAACWEFEQFGNHKETRSILERGILRHPKAELLYKAFIKTELVKGVNLNEVKNFDFVAYQSIAVNKAMDIYNHSKTNIFNIQFLVDLLEMLEIFNFTYKLQDQIVQDLSQLFPDHELTWHTLAQRELNGYHLDDSFGASELPASSGSKPDITPQHYTKVPLKNRIELCASIYEIATLIFRTPKICTYYINAMNDLNSDIREEPKLKYTCLLKSYKVAHEASALTEIQYVQYIAHLTCSNDSEESKHFILEVLERATSIYSTSLDLWFMFLKYWLKQKNELKFREKLYVAIEKCGEQSIPLRRLLNHYLFTVKAKRNRKAIEAFFREQIDQSTEPISTYYKVEYIQWLSVTHSVHRARKMFYSFIRKSPSYELHEKMIEINKRRLVHKNIEEQIVDSNFIAMRNCYDLATLYFGTTKVDLWIEYIKFEKEFGDIKEMNVVLSLAQGMLDSTLLPDFLSKYNLLKSK